MWEEKRALYFFLTHGFEFGQGSSFARRTQPSFLACWSLFASHREGQEEPESAEGHPRSVQKGVSVPKRGGLAASCQAPRRVFVLDPPSPLISFGSGMACGATSAREGSGLESGSR